MDRGEYIPVDAIEECIMSCESSERLSGLRQFRFEYGGHASECRYEGRLLLPDGECAEKVAALITAMLNMTHGDMYHIFDITRGQHDRTPRTTGVLRQELRPRL